MCAECKAEHLGGEMRLGKGMNAFRKPERSISLSLDVQDVALLQPKASLVLLKEAEQGLDVHLMIEIDHLRCGILNFWHCDWLSNCNREGDRLERRATRLVAGGRAPKGLL